MNIDPQKWKKSSKTHQSPDKILLKDVTIIISVFVLEWCTPKVYRSNGDNY